MTNDQRKFLQQFCEEYPPTEWTINSIEYPAGVTSHPGCTDEKTHLDTIKVVYTLDNDPDRMYVDYIGTDGYPVHTESRKKVTA